MGACIRAWWLAGTVTLACGGKSIRDATDAAARDAAAAQDVAAEVRAPPEDAGCVSTPCEKLDAGRCGTGTVTFRLDPGPGGPWQASGSGDEEPNWLALFTASGTPLYQTPAEWAAVDCNCAGGYPIPIGWYDAELTDAGSTQSWDGFYFEIGQFSDSGACPSLVPGGATGSCLAPRCAPPGSYVAYMCACDNIGPSSGIPSRSGVPSSYAYSVADCADPTCVRVPFEYPSQNVVVGTVSASDQ